MPDAERIKILKQLLVVAVTHLTEDGQITFQRDLIAIEATLDKRGREDAAEIVRALFVGIAKARREEENDPQNPTSPTTET